MRRRDFIKTIGGAAAGWPLAARAQQAGTRRTIGFLGANTPSLDSRRIAAFVQRLRERGWIEGHTVAIEYRWAEGRTLGLEVTTPEIRRPADIASAFEALKGRADALYVVADPLVFTNRAQIHTLAMGARLPTMYGFREYVDGGGFISYGADVPDLFRRAADYVDKILRGTKPAGIPVEQPTKLFDLVINLTTAKALGIEVPATLLARADEVIE